MTLSILSSTALECDWAKINAHETIDIDDSEWISIDSFSADTNWILVDDSSGQNNINEELQKFIEDMTQWSNLRFQQFLIHGKHKHIFFKDTQTTTTFIQHYYLPNLEYLDVAHLSFCKERCTQIVSQFQTEEPLECILAIVKAYLEHSSRSKILNFPSYGKHQNLLMDQEFFIREFKRWTATHLSQEQIETFIGQIKIHLPQIPLLTWLLHCYLTTEYSIKDDGFCENYPKKIFIENQLTTIYEETSRQDLTTLLSCEIAATKKAMYIAQSVLKKAFEKKLASAYSPFEYYWHIIIDWEEETWNLWLEQGFFIALFPCKRAIEVTLFNNYSLQKQPHNHVYNIYSIRNAEEPTQEINQRIEKRMQQIFMAWFAAKPIKEELSIFLTTMYHHIPKQCTALVRSMLHKFFSSEETVAYLNDPTFITKSLALLKQQPIKI